MVVVFLMGIAVPCRCPEAAGPCGCLHVGGEPGEHHVRGICLPQRHNFMVPGWPAAASSNYSNIKIYNTPSASYLEVSWGGDGRVEKAQSDYG